MLNYGIGCFELNGTFGVLVATLASACRRNEAGLYQWTTRER